MSVLAPAQDDRIFDAAKVARKLNENHWMSCIFSWNVHIIWYTRWTWLIIHALVVNFSWRVFCVSIQSLWLCIKVLQREYCTLLITWLKHHPLFLKIHVVQLITSLSTFVVYFIACNFQSNQHNLKHRETTNLALKVKVKNISIDWPEQATY